MQERPPPLSISPDLSVLHDLLLTFISMVVLVFLVVVVKVVDIADFLACALVNMQLLLVFFVIC